jgi:HEAT repeat protein
MMSETYRDPVAQLLTLGDPRHEGEMSLEWRDYLALGLTAEQIPELARMALDEGLHWADPDSAEVWAPLHAWRALGQLRAESAVEPLLELLDRIEEYDDDWLQEDLPEAFGMIGPAAMPGLRDFLADTNYGEWARITAGGGLVKIVEQFPESREQAVAIITEQLRHFAEQERVLNAFLVDALCNLKAVESAAVIEQAFAAGKVDLSVLGDWEEAQILLGLLEERLTPAPNFLALEWGAQPFLREPRIGKPATRKASKQKKAKRKQAKASRRRNRRR